MRIQPTIFSWALLRAGAVATGMFAATLLIAAATLAADGRADRPRPQAPPPPIAEDRFYALGDAAKESFDEGKIDDARKFAQELLTAVPHFKGNWNYGNALQDSHLVLGRIAVRENRIEEAKRHLYESAKSAGSVSRMRLPSNRKQGPYDGRAANIRHSPRLPMDIEGWEKLLPSCGGGKDSGTPRNPECCA